VKGQRSPVRGERNRVFARSKLHAPTDESSRVERARGAENCVRRIERGVEYNHANRSFPDERPWGLGCGSSGLAYARERTITTTFPKKAPPVAGPSQPEPGTQTLFLRSSAAPRS
jgi:hypothetical protein